MNWIIYYLVAWILHTLNAPKYVWIIFWIGVGVEFLSWVIERLVGKDG